MFVSMEIYTTIIKFCFAISVILLCISFVMEFERFFKVIGFVVCVVVVGL